jgi:peptidoglycan hydrolase-like protein with peptidoglycan-binding domain
VSVTHPRRTALAGLGLVLVAVAAIVVVDPFRAGKPSRASDGASRTSLATVTRRSLSSQTQVNATLGYGGAANIRLPAGTPPSAVQQAEQAVTSSERMLDATRASLAADSTTLASAKATTTATLRKQAVDRVSLSSAQAALSSAEASASAARSTAADYGQGATFTTLPALGRVISRGQSVFALNGRPTDLLYGSLVPLRAFLAGMSPGKDVQALNANLAALGYGGGSSGETFNAATEAAIRAFQSARGIAPTGELLLGSVVFEPGPVRVTRVTPEVGASAAPGPVLAISSTRPQVTIALSAAQQSSVKVGDRVSITLPNQQTTPGVISSVGTVAKAPASKEGNGGGGPESGEEGGPTVEVDVTPSEPRAIGHLDESPAEVSITTASVPETLCVPVDALLALAGGGYALEVAEGAARHLEAVTLGLFDDAEGLVQVSGANVRAGQHVVVPS